MNLDAYWTPRQLIYPLLDREQFPEPIWEHLSHLSLALPDLPGEVRDPPRVCLRHLALHLPGPQFGEQTQAGSGMRAGELL